MLELKMTHPMFDLHMELLATLPLDGCTPTALNDLQADFGFRTQRELREVIGRVAARYGLRPHYTHMIAQQRCVILEGRGRDHAYAAAQAYWLRIMGETTSQIMSEASREHD